MMKQWIYSKYFWRLWVPGGSLLAVTGCGLSDAQLTSILQSAITTGLNALLSQMATAMFGAISGGTV